MHIMCRPALSELKITGGGPALLWLIETCAGRSGGCEIVPGPDSEGALSEGEFTRGCPGTPTTVLRCVLTMLSVLSVRSIKCLS